MDYLRRLARDFSWNVFRKQKEEPVVEISRLDAYFNVAYKILIWENPVLSWTALGFLHVLFWFIVYFQVRLYGIIFLTILIIFLTDLYFERNGLQAPRTASSEAIREVVNVCKTVFLYLRTLRKDNPSLFCVTMCTIFLGLSMMSRNVSGYFLTYLIMLSTFFGPLLISKLPPEYKATFASAVHALSTNDGVLAETELIPFLSAADKDKDPELESLLTDKTVDSITNSLISGINSMPSYLEAEGSLDGLEEDDLVPQIKTAETSHTPPGEYSSESDSDHKNMRFDSGHFNGDSSSEDENNYTKGLRFSEVRDFPDSQQPAAAAQNLLSNLAAMGTSLVANVLTSAAAVNLPKRKDSDSSEFEFVNSDEVDEQTT